MSIESHIKELKDLYRSGEDNGDWPHERESLLLIAIELAELRKALVDLAAFYVKP